MSYFLKTFGRDGSMSRIEILEASLVKKEALLDAAFEAHFADVKSANGQPLNDKRNGSGTLRRWEKQDDALRTKLSSIEKTKAAIERGRAAIARVENVVFPPCVQELIAEGILTVWRKYPRFVFVKGAGKARIKFENGKLFASHYETLPADEYAIFKDVCNVLAQKMRESPCPKR